VHGSHIVFRFRVELRLEVSREGITEDTSENELDEHVEGCNEERVGKGESIGGEHPFVVDP
jgi:hypothetical protein